MSLADRTSPAMPRDLRLDMFRGLALAMIFINHAPGTIYELGTSRNFGFSDAAEAFVLMSGISAGLAYSHRIAAAPLPGALRVWARARQLYFVHVTTTAVALAIFSTAALWFGLTGLLRTNNIAALFDHPLGAIIGLPLLTHQLGYFNILPLYFVLLLATPAALLVALRWPLAVLVASVAIWAAAGQWHLNFPSYPLPGGWFFDPLSWQLIFVVGLLSGSALRQGRAFVPFSRALFVAALVFVGLVLLWVRFGPVAHIGLGALSWLSDHGVPAYLIWFEKANLPLPRLLHALAVAYVLSSIPQVTAIARSVWARPLVLLGQHALPVFAVGSVLDMVVQAAKAAIPPDPVTDGLMLGGGLLILLVLAYALDRVRHLRAAPQSSERRQPIPALVPQEP